MHHGKHHLDKRKRAHIKNQEYPHPDKKLKFLDEVCLLFSVLMPATTIPQIWVSLVDSSGNNNNWNFDL